MYLEQLKSPAHGDLRVRVVPNPQKSEPEHFESMKIGDTWPEANLKPIFDFLMRCKHTRTSLLLVMPNKTSKAFGS